MGIHATVAGLLHCFTVRPDGLLESVSAAAPVLQGGPIRSPEIEAELLFMQPIFMVVRPPPGVAKASGLQLLRSTNRM